MLFGTQQQKKIVHYLACKKGWEKRKKEDPQNLSYEKVWNTRRERYGPTGFKEKFKLNSSNWQKGHAPWNKGKKGSIPWNKGLTIKDDDRIAQPWLGKRRSNKTIEKMREAGKKQKRHPCSEATKRKIGEANKGHKHTKESKQKMSLSHSRIWKSKTEEERKQWKQKNREGNLGKKQTKKTKEKIQKSALRQWKIKREKMLNSLHTSRDRRPNIFEKNFFKYCKNIGLTSIRYVGNGSFWITVPKEIQIEGRAVNPDFIIAPFSKTKTVIETMGLYWHTSENIQKRKQIYQKSGINCIVITDEEFYGHPGSVNQKLKQIWEICK